MAGETGALALENTEHIPIAQLNPEVTAPATRSIRAVVTLTWPYSSATGSVAFLLSEPDFRLRRAKGQVRVRFSGSSAKAVRASGIASGDEIVLSLDGVEWVSNDATVVTPGRGIEYELGFSERLLLEFRAEDSQEVKRIDLDHPAPADPTAAPAQPPSPEPEEPLRPLETPIVNRTAFGINIGDEWSSPAFLKRARLSYGSLYESDYDIFAEEDGSIPGKGRKKTRLSSSWRYKSRSPTPEAEEPEVESLATSPEALPAPKAVPMMADEGCQTVDFGNSDATEDVAQALADFSRQAINVGSAAYPVFNGSASFPTPQVVDASSINDTNAVKLPTIRTETFAREGEVPEVEPPNLPGFQLEPSEALSLLSQPVSKRGTTFSNGDLPMGNTDHSFNHRSTSPTDRLLSPGHLSSQQLLGNRPGETHGNGDAVADEDEEDIYTASPAGRRQQEPGSGFSDLLEQDVTHDGMEVPIFDNQFISENQYGDWLSAGAQLSNTASPRNEPSMESSHGSRVHDDTEELLEVEEQLGSVVELPHSEYPELADELSGHITSNWGASSVVYPELPGYGDQASPLAHQPPGSPTMSRSQSAQSDVVDLTDSDEDLEAVVQHSGDESLGSVEIKSEEEGALQGREDGVGQPVDLSDDGDFEEENFDDRDPTARQINHYEHTDSEADGEEEGDYEQDEEEEEVVAKIPSSFGSELDDYEQMEDDDQDEEGNYDNEEGSYDEEDLNEEELTPISRPQPEVIDLLSSDDEDDMLAKPSIPTAGSQGPSLKKNLEYPAMPEDSSVDSNDDAELEAEESLQYAEMSEIKTSIPGPQPDYPSPLEEAEDDDMSGDELPANTALLRGGSDGENEDSGDSTQEYLAQGAEIESEDAVNEELSAAVSQELLARVEEVIEDPKSRLDALTVEEDNNVDFRQQIEVPQDSKPGRMDVESPARLVATAPPPLTAPPEKRSLFNSVFGLDGAHDEPRFGASYRTMSKEDGTQPSSVLLRRVFGASSNSSSKEENMQLPTPEDTQVSRKTVSIENSFSSVNEANQHSDVLADVKDVDQVDASRNTGVDEIEVERSSSEALSPITNIQTISKTVTVTVEVPVEIGMMDTGGYEVETRTEDIRHTSEVIQTINNIPSNDIHESVRSLNTAQEESVGDQDEPTEADEAIEEDESIEDDNPAKEDVSYEFDQPVEEHKLLENDLLEEDKEFHGSEHEAENAIMMESIARALVAEQQSDIGLSSLRSHDGDGDSRTRPQSAHRVIATEEQRGIGLGSLRSHDSDVDSRSRPQSSHGAAASEKQSSIGLSSLRSHDGEENSQSRPQSSHGAAATEEPESQTENPRRSARRTNQAPKAAVNQKEIMRPVTPDKATSANMKEKLKSTTSLKNATPLATKAAENMGPVTPLKSRGAAASSSPESDESPLVVFKNLETPKGHDASIDLALEASDASSPPQHNLRKPQVADFKLRLKRALRTELSEFTSLKVLRYHLTKKLDFLAVATTTPPEPQRAKNGPRQYQITFNITDPSIAPSGVTEVQVFRPYKDALPIIKAGDGILLRNFLVMSVQQSRNGGPAFALRSTQEDASSWAVFKDDNEVEIRGPPVEYGNAEKNHVMQLKTWYANLDDLEMAKIARANGDKGATAGIASAKKRDKA
ncbi:uncharacterized protein RCO7_09018 [Rhynchosporium graminicola]|uniref:Telomeric single stranded DNA binding POT1/Cdc13 domain-containing protein n=1 Tax=Rhynchosporium graminicola TaxID=2792576 RepID=A0A1E1LV69_9HELO|nr:uncharacterized protein RCO7_09018 [Rhynchosporium commune]